LCDAVCLDSAVLAATWRCRQQSVEWVGHPDLSRCISPDVAHLTDASQRLFDEAGINVTAIYYVHVCYSALQMTNWSWNSGDRDIESIMTDLNVI